MPPWRIEHLPCPNCGVTIELRLWTVLDLGRDPDLRRRFLGGEINVLRCPACGETGFVLSSLAMHDPDAGQTIFFIPDTPEISDDPAGRPDVREHSWT